MSAKIDMVGKRFGRLTVIEECGRQDRQVMWKCKCDCGRETVARGYALRHGAIQSCGCLQLETMQKRWKAMRKKNNFRVVGDVVYVKLSNSKSEMICDLEDWQWLRNYCWSLDTTGYARSGAGHAHSLVHKSKSPWVTDHINRNKLDNRKSNLRSITQRENSLNSDRHDRKLARIAKELEEKRKKPSRKKAVEQLDLNGNVIATYESVTKASNTVGSRHVGECCQGKRKTCKGSMWRYATSNSL